MRNECGASGAAGDLNHPNAHPRCCAQDGGKPFHTLVTIAGLDPRRRWGPVSGTMMIKRINRLGRAALAVFALTGAAAAQNAPPSSNPACVRLEGQLAEVNRGTVDTSRTDQVKRAQDDVAKSQADLDRMVAQANKAGCESQGFFSLFSGLSPQCGPMTSQIRQMRDTLARKLSDLEQLKSGNGGQDGPRRAIIAALAQNNCGPQYAAAAGNTNTNGPNGPRGFLDALLGGGQVINQSDDGAPSGTYRTVCVRTCDGYYFPISYSTMPNRFLDDQRACQRQCPATDVQLYSFRNPGEGMDHAVSINGAPYTELPNAFRYRKEVVSACSCRRVGQSWADALKNADDSSTLESGDIVVTDQNAKALSQAPPSKLPKGSTAQPAASTAPPSAPAQTAPTTDASNTDPSKRTVRSVGQPFVASH
jgi:hypothetical protein